MGYSFSKIKTNSMTMVKDVKDEEEKTSANTAEPINEVQKKRKLDNYLDEKAYLARRFIELKEKAKEDGLEAIVFASDVSLEPPLKKQKSNDVEDVCNVDNILTTSYEKIIQDDNSKSLVLAGEHDTTKIDQPPSHLEKNSSDSKIILTTSYSSNKIRNMKNNNQKERAVFFKNKQHQTNYQPYKRYDYYGKNNNYDNNENNNKMKHNNDKKKNNYTYHKLNYNNNNNSYQQYNGMNQFYNEYDNKHTQYYHESYENKKYNDKNTQYYHDSYENKKYDDKNTQYYHDSYDNKKNHDSAIKYNQNNDIAKKDEKKNRKNDEEQQSKDNVHIKKTDEPKADKIIHNYITLGLG